MAQLREVMAQDQSRRQKKDDIATIAAGQELFPGELLSFRLPDTYTSST
jgi:hypothetical protein